MALNNLGLGVIIRVDDQASTPLSGIAGGFTGLDGTVGKTSTSMIGNLGAVATALSGVAAASALVTGAALSLADKAGEFQRQLALVGVVSGATAEQLDQLHDSAIDLALATQFSPDEVVKGQRALAQAGFATNQILAALPGVLDLAAGGMISVDEAAASVTTTLALFGLTADKSSEAVDKLLKFTQKFKISGKDLDLAIGSAGKGISVVREEMDQLLPLLGIFVQNSATGQQAAFNFNSAMVGLSKIKATKALEKLGLEVRNADDSLKPMQERVLLLFDAMKDLSVLDKEKFFEDNFSDAQGAKIKGLLQSLEVGMQDASGAILTGRELLDALTESFEDAEGTAKSFREAATSGFAGMKILMEGTIDSLIILLGEPLADAFEGPLSTLLDFVRRIVTAFSELPQGTKELIGQVVLVIGAIGGLATGAVATGVAIAGIIAAVKISAVALVVMAKAALVLLPVIAAIGLAAGALFIIWENDLGGLKTFAVGAFDKIKLAVQALVQLFSDGGFSGAVREELNQVENAGLKDFVITIGMIGFRIKAFFEGVIEGFQNTLIELEPVFTELKDAFGGLSDAVGTLFNAFTEDASNLPSDEYRSFGETVGEVAAEIIGFFVTIITWVARYATGVIIAFSSAKAFIVGALGRLSGSFESVIDSITDLLVTLGLLDEESGSTSDSMQALGTIITTVLVTSLIVLVESASFLIGLFSLWLDLIDLFVKAIKGDFGTQIRVLAIIIATVVAPVLAIIGALLLLKDAFDFVVTNAKAIFSVLLEILLAPFTLLEEHINAVFLMLSSLLDALPDFVLDELPSDLADFAKEGFEVNLISDLKQDTIDALFTPTEGVNPESFPAGVESAGAAGQGADIAEGLEVIKQTLVDIETKKADNPTVIQVQVGEEVILEAVANASAEEENRTGGAVSTF